MSEMCARSVDLSVPDALCRAAMVAHMTAPWPRHLAIRAASSAGKRLSSLPVETSVGPAPTTGSFPPPMVSVVRSAIPPVKSTMASAERPPSSAAYCPIRLANAFSTIAAHAPLPPFWNARRPQKSGAPSLSHGRSVSSSTCSQRWWAHSRILTRPSPTSTLLNSPSTAEGRQAARPASGASSQQSPSCPCSTPLASRPSATGGSGAAGNNSSNRRHCAAAGTAPRELAEGGKLGSTHRAPRIGGGPLGALSIIPRLYSHRV
eukprot:scaffold56795_cov28-Tisochrysis_lutea.AAC.1